MRKMLFAALFMLLLSCAALADGRDIAVHTTVTKWGELPDRFDIEGQALPDGTAPGDFSIEGAAVSWDGQHSYPFTCAASDVAATARGWSLRLEGFPHRYGFVRALDVRCAAAPELGFSFEDIDRVETDVADDFEPYEDYEHRVTAQVFAPQAEGPLPVVLVMHGWGETDPLRSYRLATGWAESENQQKRPCIVIAPYINTSFYGSETARYRIYEGIVMLIDELVDQGRADPQRIYLVGNSFGGMACFELACQYPDRFAAMLALCPALSYSPRATVGLDGLTDMPILIAHAVNDETVPSSVSIDAYEKLRAAGNERVALRLFSDEEMSAAGATLGYEQLYSFHHAELVVMEDEYYAEWLFDVGIARQ